MKFWLLLVPVETFVAPCAQGAMTVGQSQAGVQGSEGPPSGGQTATPAPEAARFPSKDVKPPRLLHPVKPEYTAEARAAKLSGVCLVSLVVNAQGQPERVRVVRSIASSLPPDKQRVAENLDQNAVKAVSQSQFSPASYHGNPVPVLIDVEVDFRP